jgi:hypothetical protein
MTDPTDRPDLVSPSSADAVPDTAMQDPDAPTTRRQFVHTAMRRAVYVAPLVASLALTRPAFGASSS